MLTERLLNRRIGLGAGQASDAVLRAGENNPHLWAKFSLRLPVHNLSWNCGKVHLNFSLPCKPPAEKFCTKNQEARLRSQIGPILHTAPTSTDDKRGCRARRRTQSVQGLRVPGRQPRFPPARGHCGGAPRVPTPTPAPAEPILRLTFLRAPELPKSAPAKLLHAPTKASKSRPAALHQRPPFPRSLSVATDGRRGAARAKPPPERYRTRGEKGGCVFFLWRPLVGGGRSIPNVARPGNRER